MRLVDQAHLLIEDHLRIGDIAIDATVGNGHDTAFLAAQVGPEGKVFGFDLQEMAIEVAKLVLTTKRCQKQCELFQCGHENQEQQIPVDYHGRIAIAMFNLGYLPHGDKDLVTKPDTTRAALDQSLRLLKPGGLLSILAYRGHPGGMEEYEAVACWIHDHQDDLHLIHDEDSEHPEGKGPFLWLLQKSGSEASVT